jgi:hypothetical protein
MNHGEKTKHNKLKKKIMKIKTKFVYYAIHILLDISSNFLIMINLDK